MAGLGKTTIQTLHRRLQAEADRAKALEKDAADLRKKVKTSVEGLFPKRGGFRQSSVENQTGRADKSCNT